MYQVPNTPNQTLIFSCIAFNTHTHTHTHSNTYTHASTQVHAHAHTHVHACAHTYTLKHTYIHRRCKKEKEKKKSDTHTQTHTHIHRHCKKRRRKKEKKSHSDFCQMDALSGKGKKVKVFSCLQITDFLLLQHLVSKTQNRVHDTKHANTNKSMLTPRRKRHIIYWM